MATTPFGYARASSSQTLTAPDVTHQRPAPDRIVSRRWNSTLPTCSKPSPTRCPIASRSIAGDRRLTYRELDERANRVAHYLRDVGVLPGQHVGIYAFNRAEWVESMLGCFKARAVPINVNYRYVVEELRYLFDNADLVALDLRGRVRTRTSPRSCPAYRSCTISCSSTTARGTRHRGARRGRLRARARRPRLADPRRTSPALRRRPLHPLHGRHHRHAEGRHVARRGHLLRGDGRRELRRPGDRTARGHRRRTSARRPASASRCAADARQRAMVHVRRALRRQLGHARTRAAASTPTRSGTSSTREGVNVISLVGDAMARPLVDALAHRQAPPSLFALVSGGAILSPAIKQELNERAPNVASSTRSARRRRAPTARSTSPTRVRASR